MCLVHVFSKSGDCSEAPLYCVVTLRLHTPQNCLPLVLNCLALPSLDNSTAYTSVVMYLSANSIPVSVFSCSTQFARLRAAELPTLPELLIVGLITDNHISVLVLAWVVSPTVEEPMDACTDCAHARQLSFLMCYTGDKLQLD